MKIKEAIEVMNYHGFKLVLFNENDVITSDERGVKPLLELLVKGNYKDYKAVDCVVGKASAFLYVLLGIKNVYAKLISKGALEVFQKYQITISYNEDCEYILNREANDLCPMEKAVLNIDDEKTALKAIVKTYKELSNK